MALEEALEANTKALNAHTAALEKFVAAGGASAGGAAAAGAAAGGTKETKGPKKPKHTQEQMKASVMSVKDHEKLGAEAAKTLIEKHAGGAGKKLADLSNMPEKFDAVVAEAAELIAAADVPDEGDGDGGL